MTAEAKKSRSNEIIIAILGLVGVLATAVISNWDKMFPNRGTVAARYEGYRPTGNFETELRYNLEVTGARKSFEGIPKLVATMFYQGQDPQRPRKQRP